jgi:ELWxxDGT repeat protein
MDLSSPSAAESMVNHLRKGILLAAAALSCAFDAGAQEAAPEAPSSDPSRPIGVGNFLVFAATDALHGRELRGCRPPAGPVELLSDLEPGRGSSDPTNLCNVSGGVAYFSAWTQETGRELWQITSADDKLQVLLAKDIVPGPMSSDPVPMGCVNHMMAFYAGTIQNGQEPWVAGIRNGDVSLLKNLIPGPPGSLPMGVSATAAGERVVFNAIDNSDRGLTLWSTDGSPDGTIRLADLDDHSSGPLGLGDGFFICQHQPDLGTELWYSPRADQAPALLVDLIPGKQSGFPEQIQTWGSSILFRAEAPNAGKEPWISDGTAAGTRLLLDINPGPGSSEPERFTEAGSFVYFVADDGVHGKELWRTGGTAESTTLVYDVRTGAAGSNIFSMTGCGDGVVFAADDGESGEELWGSAVEGTTKLLADINPGPGDAGPHEMFYLEGSVFFAATNPQYGREFWRLQVASGEVIIAGDINLMPAPNASSAPREITPFKSGAVMAAYDTTFGEELWIVHSPEQVDLVLDIFTGIGSSSIGEITAGDTGVWFRAEDADHGIELWFSDGTGTGTHMAHDIDGAGSSVPSGLFFHNGCLYFSADAPESGREPYRVCSNGALQMLADIAPGKSSSDPDQFTVAGDVIYFVAEEAEHGRELWQVLPDGQVEMVLDLTAPVAQGSAPVELAASPLGLLFSAERSTHGREPWLLRRGGVRPRLLYDIRH